MSSYFPFTSQPIDSLPAVLIGGPPHSGKSVLLTSLSHALRARGIDHYALRASPDGEGDWANIPDQSLVRQIRLHTKGVWTTAWLDRIYQDLMQRRLPLLVDMGGRPTPEQERLFSACTHAILLTGDAEAQAEWQQSMMRNKVTLLAGLTSRLNGEEHITATTPILQGVITGLERATTAQGPLFLALVERLSALFAQPGSLARQQMIRQAPTDLVVDLDRVAQALGFTQPGQPVNWQPVQLVKLLDYLPENTALAIESRGTNWIHSALALFAYPATYYHLDARLGWVKAIILPYGEPLPDAPIQFTLTAFSTYALLHADLPFSYIDYVELAEVRVPPVPTTQGLVLSGKLPYWLFTSLALTYRDLPWLAIYQPQLAGAIIVYAPNDQTCLGQVISIPTPNLLQEKG